MRCEPGWRKKRNNRRIESTPLSILLSPSVSTLLRIPPSRRTSGKPVAAWQKLTEHARKNAERERKIHTRDPFPVSTFNRGRVRAHTEEET